MTTIRHFAKHAIAASLLAGLGFAAVAQTATTAAEPQRAASGAMGMHRGNHGDHEKMRAKMQERRAQRMAELKAKLNLTSAQEGAWTSFTDSIKPPAPGSMGPRMDHTEMAKLTTPERIEKMRAMRDKHIAAMDKRAEATKTFYATLNADQKKTFDTEFHNFMKHRMGPGQGGEHAGRGGAGESGSMKK